MITTANKLLTVGAECFHPYSKMIANITFDTPSFN